MLLRDLISERAGRSQGTGKESQGGVREEGVDI